MQSQVRFNRVPEKVPEKVPGGFGIEPGQVQPASEEGSREGSVELNIATVGDTIEVDFFIRNMIQYVHWHPQNPPHGFLSGKL